MGNYRLGLFEWRVQVALFCVVFPIAMVIFTFSSCNVRRRGDKHACQDGSAERCLAVGQFYEARTDGIIGFLMSNAKTAKDYYQRGCKLGNLPSCAHFGHMKIAGSYDQALDEDSRHDDGMAALTTACNGGITDSCHELADALDPAKAAPVLEKLCKGGDKGSCDKLVAAIAATDPKAALEIAAKQCDEGNDAECRDAGKTLIAGTSAIPADATRGIALLTKACDRGAAGACRDLGDAYGDGSLPADPARAAEMFAKACAHDDADACFDQAKGLIDSDPAKSLQLFTASCNKGDLRGCDAIGDMWRVGTDATPRDRKQALSTYDTACRAGNDFDCNKRDCMKSPDNASDACGKVYLWQDRFVYKLGGRFDMR